MARAAERQQPSARRLSETRRIVWQGRTVHVTVGYDESGRNPIEIFYSSGYRSGSDMEVLVSDICIALSVILQHWEITAPRLQRSMSVAFSLKTGKVEPASMLGLVLREITRPPAWLQQEAEHPAQQPQSEEEAGQYAGGHGPKSGRQSASAAGDGKDTPSDRRTEKNNGTAQEPS